MKKFIAPFLFIPLFALGQTPKGTNNQPPVTVNKKEAQDEHAGIGIGKETRSNRHTQNPDAQWFPDAGLGLFLHWDEASTGPVSISWPIIAGRGMSDSGIPWEKEIPSADIDRMIRERKYMKNQITPAQYWAMAKQFNPYNYHPEIWLKKAKEAGFTYAVLTTKHHNGFCMWPSAYSDLTTRNTPMAGRDLVREYVNACRKVGLKVGLYFSGPDWYIDRDYMNFFHYTGARKYPQVPRLDMNYAPQKEHTPEEIKAHQKDYADKVRGQLEELLTNYGKIDIIWFDGKAGVPDFASIMPIERIHELQPGIIMNSRFHGKGGDFVTPERELPADLHLKADEWGEFCTTWNGAWSYLKKPYRPLNDVLTEIVRSRAAGVNTLLGIGPMGNGDLAPEAYQNIDKLAYWMKINGEAIYGTRALQGRETSTVLATEKGKVRYLYLLPDKTYDDISITGLAGSYQANLLGSNEKLTVTNEGEKLSVSVPDGIPGKEVRVVKLSPKR
ncbi:alpha-L-fucosidase [Mucilaginibacter gracilis]|nr:alpha-L-fucosidase [Mucilaginibacter gracilis]